MAKRYSMLDHYRDEAKRGNRHAEQSARVFIAGYNAACDVLVTHRPDLADVHKYNGADWDGIGYLRSHTYKQGADEAVMSYLMSTLAARGYTAGWHE